MKKYIKIVCIQLVLILCVSLFLVFRYEAYEINFHQEEMGIQNTGREIGEGSYLEASMEGMRGVVTPAFSLEKGIYYIEFSYETRGIVKGGLIYDILHKSKELVQDHEFILNPDKSVMSYRMEVRDTSDMRFRLRLTADAMDGDYVLLKSVKIIRSKLTCVKDIVTLILLVFVGNLLYFLYRYYQKCNREDKTILILLGCVIFWIGLPLYQSGLAEGADLRFHLWRMEGLYEGLMDGQFPVRIQPGWLDGHGYAVSVFYGDILLYFPALLRMAGFTIEEAFKLCMIGMNAATVTVCYWSFKKIAANNIAALIGTMLYAGSMEHLYRLYSSSMIGMFCAMTFYPIVLLGLYLLFTEDTEKKEYKKIWLYLVIGYSGLLMTHMISCLIVGLFTIIVCVVFVKKLFRKATILELGKALLMGILVNLWFLVPFFHYILCGTTRLFSGKTDWEGLDYYVELAGFMKNARPVSNLFFDFFQSGQGLGYALTFVLCLYVVLIPWQKKDLLTKRSRYVFGFALVGLWFCSKLFPAVEVAKVSRVFVKVFYTIQHQHRFLGVAGILVSCLAVLLFSMPILKRKELFIIAVGFFAIIMYQDMQYFSTLEANARYLDKIDLESKTGKGMLEYGVGNGEYIPVETDVSILKEEVNYDTSQIQMDKIEREYLNYKITAHNTSNQQQVISLPLLYYEGYISKDSDTGADMEIEAGENGCVDVSLPANYSGSFEVRFATPWYWRVAEVVSMMALLAFIVYEVRKQRLRV